MTHRQKILNTLNWFKSIVTRLKVLKLYEITFNFDNSEFNQTERFVIQFKGFHSKTVGIYTNEGTVIPENELRLVNINTAKIRFKPIASDGITIDNDDPIDYERYLRYVVELKEIERSDLPLYVDWKYKSKEFERLLKDE